VQVAQLVSNPVFETAALESAAVPEPVMHEAQIEFVASQAYTVSQESSQDKNLTRNRAFITISN